MYTIKEIKKIIGSTSILVFKEAKVENLLIDSRKLSQPQKALFFAIKGKRLNGHKYIETLYNKGVRNFIVENNSYKNNYTDANFLMVKNSIKALQTLVEYHRTQFKMPVIGITGSNGKTIVKEWIHQLLHEDYKTIRSPKSYNSQVGVPLSVWKLNKSHELAIFEAGISEPDEMQNLQKIISPSIGIFTNIGHAHAQNFISESHKVKEKLKLFIKSEIVIYCKDHQEINNCITGFFSNTINDENSKTPVLFSWSINFKADLQITQLIKKEKKTEIECLFLNKKINFCIPFIDKSSLENSFHCIALMLCLKYDVTNINRHLLKLKRIEMRLEQKKGLNNCIIINDSYNSDIDSLKIALEFLVQQELTEKRTVILSDILQSGFTETDLYDTVSEMLHNAKIETFIGIGENIFKYKYLLEKNATLKNTRFYKNTEDFLQEEQSSNFQDEAILLKGARVFKFERINTFLEEKIHATVFEVNLNSVIHNFHFFTSKLKPKTKVMVMVKAFAYGSGSYEIAKLLEFHRVDYLGVAYTDEGVLLRKAGIKTPIMVLNPEKSSFKTMIEFDLEPEIYNIKLLKELIKTLARDDVNNFPVHINIDTGMKRLGFDQKDLKMLCMILVETDKVKVTSIFSHLAASDDIQWTDFTNLQISKFEEAYQFIVDRLGYKPIKHLVNSSGILKFKNAHFDMVRLGLGLYGINANNQKSLETVGTFKSTISQIRTIKKDETIGYSRLGKLKKDGKIAIIAVGYADGLNRALSNGVGSVYINNKLAPIIGNICMDMTMINISDIENVKEGDEVEIFGKNILVSTVAQQINSITYEVLTSVSERVKRVFFVE